MQEMRTRRLNELSWRLHRSVSLRPDPQPLTKQVESKMISSTTDRTAQLFATDFNAVGDGLTDDTSAIRAAIQAALDVNGTLYLGAGKVYRVTEELQFTAPGKKVKITSTGPGTRLLVEIPKGVAMTFSGAPASEEQVLLKNALSLDKHIVTLPPPNIKSGHLCELVSTRAWYHDPRPPSGWERFNMGKAEGGTRQTIKLAPDFNAPPHDVKGRSLTIIDGGNRGYSATIESYDPHSKEVVLTTKLPHPTVPGTTYIFPQAFKGGLNVVQSIEKDSVELLSPLFDGYDVEPEGAEGAKESVAVRYFNPVSVHIENIKLEWVVSERFSNVEAIRLLYGRDSKFHNVEIEDFKRIAFQVERSFNTLIDFCRVKHANSRFLGYGVNVQNSTQCTVQNSYFWGCRRGVDFDSVRDFDSAYPSRLGLVDSCTNYGGGTREQGRSIATQWYPGEGWQKAKAHNYGFGSHGPAEYITYTNNTIMNTYRGIFSRGTNERIVNNRFVGKMEECVGVWFGGNCVIEGNDYTHPAITSGADSLGEDGGSITPLRSGHFDDIPKTFIGVAILGHSPVSYQRGLITARNNIVRGVRGEFLYHEWAAGEYIEDITLENNHIWYYGSSDSDPVYLINSNNSAIVRRVFDTNNLTRVIRGKFTAFRHRLRLDASCGVTPHPTLNRHAAIESAEEISVTGLFDLDRAPSRHDGTSVGEITVRPYSSLSRYTCSFQGSIQAATRRATIVLALFRGETCIAAQIATAHHKATEVPMTLYVSDEPRSAKPITYSVRLGTTTSAEKIVLNSGPGTLGPLKKSLFYVEEF